MNDLLANNLSTLARYDASLAVVVKEAAFPEGALVAEARSGAPTLTVNGLSLHSRYDPWAEGEALARHILKMMPDQVGLTPAIFGLGLGYHVLALARDCPALIVVEPDPGMIKLAFSHHDFSQVQPHVRFMIEPTPPSDLPPTFLVPHPPSVKLHQAKYDFWVGNLNPGRGSMAGPTVETAGQMKAALIDLPGVVEIMSMFRPEAVIDQADLVQAVRRRGGQLAECEIYFLLLAGLS